ncbi:MAG TPA: hypothetical protein VFV67_34015 [Actinophytocola sp.]|uniref:hypothetical protein n=1 Tax=Actinophytocola sp. TaxID=1872138 RepID=UPI002DBBB155|nr:hypothetical protein [Actinophytocola sp.]HEU5475684.1 hypothetical protein [Actinophytocola sp.]
MTRVELWGGPADGHTLDLPRPLETLRVPHCPNCAPLVTERHLYRRDGDGPRYRYAGQMFV